jgi:hypothetical protein
MATNASLDPSNNKGPNPSISYYDQTPQNQVSNDPNDPWGMKKQAQDLTTQYGVPVSYGSQQELDATGEGLGFAKALYGENIGDVGKDMADYRNALKGRQNQDYAGADSLRQGTSLQVGKAASQAGLSGVNTLAMQNQLYSKGSMAANTANQDYQDKALAAEGKDIGNRASGEAGLVTAFKGLGVSRTPASTPNYDSGCVIASHAVHNGAFSHWEKKKAIIWCEKNLHGKWWGESVRRGYRYVGKKAINNGKAPSKYAEFKNYVDFGSGKNRNFVSGVYFIARSLQMFVIGLLIKE